MVFHRNMKKKAKIINKKIKNNEHGLQVLTKPLLGIGGKEGSKQGGFSTEIKIGLPYGGNRERRKEGEGLEGKKKERREEEGKGRGKKKKKNLQIIS